MSGEVGTDAGSSTYTELFLSVGRIVQSEIYILQCRLHPDLPTDRQDGVKRLLHERMRGSADKVRKRRVEFGGCKEKRKGQKNKLALIFFIFLGDGWFRRVEGRGTDKETEGKKDGKVPSYIGLVGHVTWNRRKSVILLRLDRSYVVRIKIHGIFN